MPRTKRTQPGRTRRRHSSQIAVDVARMIHQARTDAGLTQAELADLIGTKQQAIARLEDADYDGHSLRMLERIASALNRKLEVSMVSG
jgi:ribosome-binding protein aMBF1 (putative translation factor)